jgi:hypothetical protein
MKRVEIRELSPDPIAKARAEADQDTATITGVVRTISEDAISLSLAGPGNPYLRISRDSVIAAFQDESGGVATLLVDEAADVELRVALKAREVEAIGEAQRSTGCDCTGGGYTRPAASARRAAAAPGAGLTGQVPWPWCREACEYCRDYGWYCWPCFICAIIAANNPRAVMG